MILTNTKRQRIGIGQRTRLWSGWKSTGQRLGERWGRNCSVWLGRTQTGENGWGQWLEIGREREICGEEWARTTKLSLGLFCFIYGKGTFPPPRNPQFVHHSTASWLIYPRAVLSLLLPPVLSTAGVHWCEVLSGPVWASWVGLLEMTSLPWLGQMPGGNHLALPWDPSFALLGVQNHHSVPFLAQCCNFSFSQTLCSLPRGRKFWRISGCSLLSKGMGLLRFRQPSEGPRLYLVL